MHPLEFCFAETLLYPLDSVLMKDTQKLLLHTGAIEFNAAYKSCSLRRSMYVRILVVPLYTHFHVYALHNVLKGSINPREQVYHCNFN